MVLAIPNSGSGGILQLSGVLAEKFAPEAMKNAQPAFHSGISPFGKIVNRAAKLPEFTFGSDTLRGLPMEVIDATRGSKAGREGLMA